MPFVTTDHGGRFRRVLALALVSVALAGCARRDRAELGCQARPPSVAETAALGRGPLGFSALGMTRQATLVSASLRRSDNGSYPALDDFEPLALLLRDTAQGHMAVLATEEPTVQMLLADDTMTAGR